MVDDKQRMSWVLRYPQNQWYHMIEISLFLIGGLWLGLYAITYLPRDHALLVMGMDMMLGVAYGMAQYRTMKQIEWLIRVVK